MITKLKIFKENNNILVPRNLEGREDKFKNNSIHYFNKK
jgi:hypothetical protein